MAQARLPRRAVVPLPRRAAACPLRTLCLSDYCGLESGPMNEFGEPNMGNPSVRFAEARERVGHWPLAFHPNRSCQLYETKRGLRVRSLSFLLCETSEHFRLCAPNAAVQARPSEARPSPGTAC